MAWSNNSRLDTLQAAMLIVKLKYVEEWTEQRIKNAKYYQEQLGTISSLKVPQGNHELKVVYHTFVIQSDRRDALKTFLEERGVKTKIHYKVPLHLHTMAEDLGYQENSLPVTERLAKRILSVPVHSGLKQEELEYIVSNIKEFTTLKGKS